MVRRIATAPLFSAHLTWVCPELPNQLLEPCVTNSKLSGPLSAGWPLPATRIPQEHKSADHARLVATAPRPWLTHLRAGLREIPHGRFTQWHRLSLPPGLAELPDSSVQIQMT